MLNSNVSYHFVGIGGIGMSGLAHVLLKMGHQVSGSDVQSSPVTQKLEQAGAKVFFVQHRKNVSNNQIVIYSSAISAKNPELVRARELGLCVWRRAELLSEIMGLKKSLSIAGSHGKTTTTSMLVTLLKGADLSPNFIIGGVVSGLGDSQSSWGEGEYLVVEADESDGSFAILDPLHTLVTNIDNDHMDFYESEKQLLDFFEMFCHKTPNGQGICFFNLDDPKCYQLYKEVDRLVVGFGEHEESQFRIKNFKNTPEGCEFHLVFHGEDYPFKLPMHGLHNALNAVGALSMALTIGVDVKSAQNSLQGFSGVKRRFETLYNENGSRVIEDYGHHPTEIQKTLEGLNQVYKDQKRTVFFEPHRYTRTQDCWQEFATCFEGIDELYLLPIFAASEHPIPGIDHEKLAQEVQSKSGIVVHVLQTDEEYKQALLGLLAQPGVIMLMGAGPIGKKGRQILNDV